ncbi:MULTISPECIES: TrmH family RNA methyltransferase [unclassified Bifidobacterium]|uniref:TrmH family RNA methyltransferase n=1 Tax=unclassified Bifidobacterium TaxID=2608897 RepID=UPI0011295299|nr:MULTISPECIES: TrmH family RNA methyltransferase [unclassified Bifidobacterium]TPF78205.1 RNA methyltransferase [Bifidobacterium sp. UTCIF-1]TPF79992.1 RNA methyltransferase [Bifidobacterium sp. UTCIF-24]TPF82431.1 RNA methyltransferase [Bifidobacterium sp. UTCIF-3]TPF83651.1 RNA methyltransferase [Bifidobacterium sp. UTCIF-36]TPF89517.1 RNA methyltransferase [Bifidobacterium sp. UTBIF-56]
MHAPNQISLAAKASGEPEFREIGLGPWSETHPGEPRPDNPASPNYSRLFDTELLDEGDRRNVLDRYRYWSMQAIKDDLDARGRHDFEVAVENWTHDFNIGSMVRTANAFQARRVHIVGPHKWNRKGALMTELYQHVEHHPSIAELVECWRNRIAGEIACERARAAAAAIHIRELAGTASAPLQSELASATSDNRVAYDEAQSFQSSAIADAFREGCASAQSTQSATQSATQRAMSELAAADNRIKELEAARIIALDIIPGAVPMETYRFPKRCLLLFGAEGPGLSQKALDLADDVVYISQFGSVRSINAGAAAAVAMHAWIAQHAAPASV